ncbi:MAG TPA: hypothetical protein VGI32_10015 [Steroidobacteraceae bacterium]|jgi:hypothetical protein
MKSLSLLSAALLVAGCTTLQPMDGSPAELQQRIAAGQLLKPGDRILITTTDAKTHRFAISSINAGFIQGRSESVPIAQVTEVKRRQFIRAKTAVLVIGLAVAGAVVGLAAYTATHLAIGI